MEMPRGDLYRLLFWWLALALTLMVFAFGTWRQWGVIALFAAIAVWTSNHVTYDLLPRVPQKSSRSNRSKNFTVPTPYLLKFYD